MCVHPDRDDMSYTELKCTTGRDLPLRAHRVLTGDARPPLRNWHADRRPSVAQAARGRRHAVVAGDPRGGQVIRSFGVQGGIPVLKAVDLYSKVPT